VLVHSISCIARLGSCSFVAQSGPLPSLIFPSNHAPFHLRKEPLAWSRPRKHQKRILFVPTFKLVQRLLEAKKRLELEALLKKLNGFEAIILDDLGYVQQSREAMEVLFTFFAERYERRSVLISSNLVFSQ
jgi:hypothetical protein